MIGKVFVEMMMADIKSFLLQQDDTDDCCDELPPPPGHEEALISPSTSGGQCSTGRLVVSPRPKKTQVHDIQVCNNAQLVISVGGAMREQ